MLYNLETDRIVKLRTKKEHVLAFTRTEILFKMFDILIMKLMDSYSVLLERSFLISELLV
jgi:hypothetical protein